VFVPTHWHVKQGTLVVRYDDALCHGQADVRARQAVLFAKRLARVPD
jgi:hypothetical protein